MTTTQFSRAMIEIIREYQRSILRRYISDRTERLEKRQEAGLNDRRIFIDETLLYQAGLKIKTHLQELQQKKDGYYTYSGIGNFLQYLTNLLKEYGITEEGTVIHRSRIASRYLVQAVQLMITGKTRNAHDPVMEFLMCHRMIIRYASEDQLKLYYNQVLDALNNKKITNPELHKTIETIISEWSNPLKTAVA